MIALRTLLAALFLVAIVGLPALVPRDGPYPGSMAVNAAPPDSLAYDNGNNNNGNWNGNRNSNNNNWNGNWNRNDNDDNGNGNGNRNDNNGNDNDGEGPPPRHAAPPPPPPPPSVAERCYAAGEPGALNLTLEGGTVTLDVVSASMFPRVSRVTLAKVDPSSVPATPGSRLDEIVFELRAQDGCDGGTLAELPADANLGISYNVTADTPLLRIAVWDGSRWVDVLTAPDPNPGNPYVSATVRRTGPYVLYQSR